MGYLDKTTQTVTAHFTKRGRETLANALSGNTSGDYIITKFALGDDEVDYGLWDETQQNNLEGRMIDNMPLLEGFINQQEIMNSTADLTLVNSIPKLDKTLAANPSTSLASPKRICSVPM